MVQFKSQFLTALFCTFMVIPLAACGAAGSPVMPEAALPDEPGDEPTLNDGESIEIPADEEPVADETDTQKILQRYDHLDPQNLVPDDLLKAAVLYYDSHLAQITNKNYLSVINFKARSTKARFFIINMTTGNVWAIRTAHGKGSDPEHDGYANSFSNVSGSNKSSLGVYKAAEPYNGTHGLSLRLDGLSSTNSNARPRAIVIHGANYVEEASVVQGRSLGCPAVAMENRDRVVNQLKGGSIVYAGLSEI